MTVLLIDGGGCVREWEIPELVPTLLVPVPTWVSASFYEDPTRFASPLTARFDYSEELSYPPVYRFAGLR